MSSPSCNSIYYSEAGCNPMATGILSDIFPEEKRGLVMSIFNWGIYGGYGIAFPVGRYITKLNFGELVSVCRLKLDNNNLKLIFSQGWRVCYYGAGVIAVIVSCLTAFTLREPERQAIGEETTNNQNPSAKKFTIWDVILQPRIIMLCLAASIRHCGKLAAVAVIILYVWQH